MKLFNSHLIYIENLLRNFTKFILKVQIFDLSLQNFSIIDLKNFLLYENFNRFELYIYVKKEGLISILTYLKNHTNLQFTTLIDLTCIDNIEKKNRFCLVYNLLSYKFNFRIKVCVEISEMETVPSIVNLYNASNWLEREVWDMFGIFFSNHPDLRRILTDYGFSGFPLRKDFPLTGYLEVRYNDEKKRIVYENLELAQEFRFFNFISPWEQISNKNYINDKFTSK